MSDWAAYTNREVAMPSNPTYEQGHLLVAAVRVLLHKEGRAPTVEEVAGLIEDSPEVVRVHLRWLEERGIVHIVTNPFETRVEIADHGALEGLPREGSGPQMEEEVQEFKERFKSKQEKIGKLFSTDDMARRSDERKKKLEEDLRRFKPRGAPPGGPIKED
jgi:hypothetical protein